MKNPDDVAGCSDTAFAGGLDDRRAGPLQVAVHRRAGHTELLGDLADRVAVPAVLVDVVVHLPHHARLPRAELVLLAAGAAAGAGDGEPVAGALGSVRVRTRRRHTLLVQAVLEMPTFHDRMGDDERRALSPLLLTHPRRPYGRFRLDMNTCLDLAAR